jgi:hypothetical protein
MAADGDHRNCMCCIRPYNQRGYAKVVTVLEALDMPCYISSFNVCFISMAIYVLSSFVIDLEKHII